MKKEIQNIQKTKDQTALLEKSTKKFFQELKNNKSDNDAFIRLANK